MNKGFETLRGETMTRKKWVIVILVLFVFGTAFFFFQPTKNDTDVARDELLSPKEKAAVAAVLRLHPLASEEKRLIEKKRRVSTWEEYIDERTEIALGVVVEEGALGAPDHPWKMINTPEAIALKRSEIRSQLVRATAQLRAEQPPPEDLRDLPIFDATNYPPQPAPPKYYEGPQTPEALIAEFDQYLLEVYPEASEFDEHYPKAVWLQRILDKGAIFEKDSDYGYYLSEVRRELIELKAKPDEWRSGSRGIPPTSNFEDYKEGYIERKIWENNITNKVSKESPDNAVTSVFFPRSHPDKYLPQVGRITYVRRRPDSSGMLTIGTPLTDEQRDNLLYKGIEPGDIEIVYIDEDFNVLTEKPKPYNREEWDKKHIYDIVPEGLRSHDGTIVTPERYEEIIGKPMSDEIRQRYNEYDGSESLVDPDAARREVAREAAAVEQAAAKTEFEKFQQGMRQLKEFASMSDVEVGKALEKQFRQQFLPEHPVEQLTPERLENALGTLFQHGFEEGFRRVRRDSPALAEQLEQYFGQGQKPPPEMQKKPQRPTPPKPPEAAPSEPEAP